MGADCSVPGAICGKDCKNIKGDDKVSKKDKAKPQQKGKIQMVIPSNEAQRIISRKHMDEQAKNLSGVDKMTFKMIIGSMNRNP